MVDLRNKFNDESSRLRADIETYNAQIQQRIESEAALRDALQKARMDLVSMNSTTNKVVRNSGVGNAIMERLNVELKAARVEVTRLKTELASVVAERESLARDLSVRTDRLSILESQLAEKNADLERRQMSTEALNDKVTQQRSQLMRFEGVVAELKSKLQDTTNDLVAIQGHRDRLENDKATLERRVNEVSISYNELTRTYTDEKRNYESTVRRLRSELSTLQGQLQASNGRTTELQARLQTYENKERTILAAGAGTSRSITIDADNIEQLVERLKQKLRETMQSRNELTVQLEQARLRIGEYERVVVELRSEASALAAYRDEMSNTFSKQRRQIETLQEQLRNMNELNVKLRANFEESERIRNTNNDRRVVELEREVERLRTGGTGVEELRRAYETAVRELETVTRARDSLDRELQALRQQFVALQQRAMASCTTVGDVNDCARTLLETTDSVQSRRNIVPTRRPPLRNTPRFEPIQEASRRKTRSRSPIISDDDDDEDEDVPMRRSVDMDAGFVDETPIGGGAATRVGGGDNRGNRQSDRGGMALLDDIYNN
ncbi:63.4 kDa Multifunctional domains-SbcC/ATPase, SMC, HEC1, Reovirus-sigma1, and Intermediate filament protein domains [Spodoptera frugiperda ascovirus 1a]|uniref:63.4 kDa Multifunctional domains-SbcC/ATPase, SMC, HEC1, Reovirus-sigma1, and Intermediate filament protein domains n=1 Tax=Spodoptera frugiperda ascovirus 1a TaxID=113370 RepID=Q0E555_SFAVA|nr:63.4 kDa Multifunctional domains-SbcC/ATPase, SMC, HEC1, Reovirus-sigma1, and Intermediate filament protein domains [Spodoptera frugiperda ascovirus 1a]CAL44646.1 63.4 kDa Multifunctional domains-SbcC/ATPase, SMC, HEC1, Reovirus-sigma1, and Intermediate filament protein domains [Spodoptera frugiperda ascovirus 1a]